CFFFQAEDGIRVRNVTGVQTCALPIFPGDGDVFAWLIFTVDVVGVDAEGRVEEELVQSVLGEVVVVVYEVVVHVQLAGGVLWPGAERLVSEDLHECGVAVLAGREDVVTPEGCAVVLEGFGFGRGRCRGKGTDGGCRHRECHTRGSGAQPSSEGRGHVLSPPGGAGDGSA